MRDVLAFMADGIAWLASPRPDRDPTRREFLTASSLALLGAAVQDRPARLAGDPIIDIHQHLNYTGRPDAVLLAHQRAMGVTMTVLLPAGRPVDRASTNMVHRTACEAEALGNEACWRFARAQPASTASPPTRSPTSTVRRRRSRSTCGAAR